MILRGLNSWFNGWHLKHQVTPELLRRVAFTAEIPISVSRTSEVSVWSLSHCTLWMESCPFLACITARRTDSEADVMFKDGHWRCQWTPGALFQPTIQMGTSVKSWGNVINHPHPSGGAAGVGAESPTHTDPYKRPCDVLEQMSRGRLWHMTDSSFDSPRKVCRGTFNLI